MMQKFYVAINNQPEGPFTIEELKNKNLKRTTLIWNDEYEDWFEIQNLKEFKNHFRKIPPPIPEENKKNIVHKVAIVKPKSQAKQKKKIFTRKFYNRILKFLYVSFLIGLVTLAISILFIYDLDKFNSYEKKLNRSSTISNANLPIDEYSPKVRPYECERNISACVEYLVNGRKEKIWELSLKNSVSAFIISYLIVIIYLIIFQKKTNKE